MMNGIHDILLQQTKILIAKIKFPLCPYRNNTPTAGIQFLRVNLNSASPIHHHHSQTSAGHLPC